ncbi:Mg2 transporter protein, CorA-like/Zinc transport protein ZntB [Lasallia pustulata]|uniref:Mg2 transporter protein, CorA-like/Zinc transport protein ZntB n=1 Tax=Lasallia pustulata TaxID=136370 RepID=A0A1W5CTE1_9LECA|nr:Mg2 transporter protein, CorA-like/Zinc transport protein ZntB [Lasallia pustulata]
MSDDDSAKGSINVQPKLADKTLIDLDYLIEALRHLADDVDKLQNSIEKQMNLAQMQRSMILTVLASIFIPLSFTTSYFGMNISTSNNSVSNITFNGNSTASPSIRFQGTQSSNNPVAWEIKYFWIVAIPLIFATIVLPLIASPCARWMMKANCLTTGNGAV